MARKTQSEFNRQREVFLLKLMELRREAESMVLDAPEGNTYGKKLHTQAIAQVMRAAEGIFILTPSSIADGLSKVNDLLPQIKDGSFLDSGSGVNLTNRVQIWVHKPDKSASFGRFHIKLSGGAFILSRGNEVLGEFKEKWEAQDYAETLLQEGEE